MFQKEEELEDNCADFKKISIQLQEYREKFKENLLSLKAVNSTSMFKKKLTNNYLTVETEDGAKSNVKRGESIPSERSEKSI